MMSSGDHGVRGTGAVIGFKPLGAPLVVTSMFSQLEEALEAFAGFAAAGAGTLTTTLSTTQPRKPLYS